MNPLSSKAGRGGSIVLLGQVLGRAAHLGLQLLLTRVLGVASYGLFSLARSVLQIAQQLSVLGMDEATVRFGVAYRTLADHPRFKGAVLGSLGFAIVGGSLGTVTLYFGADILATHVFGEPSLSAVLKAFSFALVPFSALIIAGRTARAQLQMASEVAVTSLIYSLMTSLFVGVALLMGLRVVGAAYGIAAGTIAAAIVGWCLVGKGLPKHVRRIAPVFEPSSLIRYAIIVLPTGLAQLLLTHADRVMLGYLRTPQDVGIYNAAAVLALNIPIFLTSFNAVFSPMVSELHTRGDSERLRELYKTITRWVLTLTGPAVLVLVVFSRQLMQIFGAGFEEGSSILVALSCAQLVNVAVGGVGYILIMTGRQTWELRNSLALGGLNVVLNLVLIRSYGAVGAGIATAVSLALINVVRLIEVWIAFGFHPYSREYFRPLAAAGISLAGWCILRSVVPFGGWSWLGGAAVMLVLYVLCLLVLGINEEDRIFLGTVVAKLRRTGQKGEDE